MQVGALYKGEGKCEFKLWAPLPGKVALHLVRPRDEVLPMVRDEYGYWCVEAGQVTPGSRYLFRLDDHRELPDPASRSQPEGVHGPSEVVDPSGFRWSDAAWKGI